MISAAAILALRDRGVTSREAPAELGIHRHTFRSLLARYGIKWPRVCRNQHPIDDRILVSGRRRCRLCWEAELNRRQQVKSPFLHPTIQTGLRSLSGDIAAAREAERALDRAIAMETAPPWLRHPVPWDNVNVRTAP